LANYELAFFYAAVFLNLDAIWQAEVVVICVYSEIHNAARLAVFDPAFEPHIYEFLIEHFRVEFNLPFAH
jgi:hypothetical protein